MTPGFLVQNKTKIYFILRYFLHGYSGSPKRTILENLEWKKGVRASASVHTPVIACNIRVFMIFFLLSKIVWQTIAAKFVKL